jgi:hypothetical protein
MGRRSTYRKRNAVSTKPTTSILVQHLVDEGRNRAELWLGPGWVVMLRRQRTADCLTHNASMNAELRGNTRDRADTKLMLATKLLE